MRIYDVAVVTPEFFSGGHFNLDKPYRNYLADKEFFEHRMRILQDRTLDGQQWNRTRWSNISTAECEEYGWETSRGSVLLVTGDQSSWRTNGSAHNSDFQSDENPEVDDQSTVLRYHTFSGSVREQISLSPHPVLYCLSLVVPSYCSLQIHLWIMLVVVVCNILMLTCFIITFTEQRGTPLVTVGDTVASFLNTPGSNVKDMCLLAEDALVGALKDDMEVPGDSIGPRSKQYQFVPLRYYQSISYIRWTIYSTSCILLVYISSYWLNEISFKYRREGLDYSFRALWKNGFGKLRDNSFGSIDPPWCYYIFSRTDACQEELGFGHVFIAATPQLAVSAVYIAMNYQITVMIQLRDWTRLALRRQPLRVSDPIPGSAQVSTYWLSLPYRYSFPLLSSSILLGWLASQALFFIRFILHDNDGTPFDEVYWGYHGVDLDTAGIQPRINEGLAWSGKAVILLLLVGVCVFVSSLALGLQSCAPGLPLGPTSSLVMAAACHPPENDRNAAKKLVQWGEAQSENSVEDGNPVRHCTITSWKVVAPKPGRWYARMILPFEVEEL